jgi:hypothetical protein
LDSLPEEAFMPRRDALIASAQRDPLSPVIRFDNGKYLAFGRTPAVWDVYQGSTEETRYCVAQSFTYGPEGPQGPKTSEENIIRDIAQKLAMREAAEHLMGVIIENHAFIIYDYTLHVS